MANAGVRGGPETRRALRELTSRLSGPLNSASKHALGPVLTSAKANLAANGSVESGRLLRILTIKRDRESSRPLAPRYLVGPDGSDSHYRTAHLVEFGTAPHWQANVQRMHPGARAKPFLRPAYEAARAAVVDTFSALIGPAIEKQAERLARRAEKKARP